MIFIIFAIFCGVLPTNILARQPDLCRENDKCTYGYCEVYAYEKNATNGPFNWTSISQTCGHIGTQSPINIVTKETKHMDVGRIGFTHDYKQKILGRFLNDGASIIFRPDNKTNLNITGGPYGFTYYQLDSIYFHWGCDNDRGSEHQINGKRFSMEMQLKHFKLSYGNINDALNHNDGLGIISFLFEADDDSHHFEPLEDFSDAVKCTRQNDWTIKTHIDLWQFFEAVEAHDYYTYSGSLTNPYCNEAVIWTIYDKPIRINSEQLKYFRRAKTCLCNHMCNNARPVQTLGTRVVTHSSNHHDSHHL